MLPSGFFNLCVLPYVSIGPPSHSFNPCSANLFHCRFILRPFTIPIATNAIKYTLVKDGYTFEAAADLNKQAPYLSVQRRYGRQVYKAHYALKEEYAMVETGYAQTDGDLPLVKVRCPRCLQTSDDWAGFSEPTCIKQRGKPRMNQPIGIVKDLFLKAPWGW